MSMTYWIDIQRIPTSLGGFSPLYCDYLSNYPKVQQFYETDFHQIQNYGKIAEHISSKFKLRGEIAAILTEQNQHFSGTEKTFENIQLLEGKNTLAIVTGQQVGMFGGPLYTIYKIITALKLTEQLNNVLPDYRFVPIFWLEGEDHDFQEMNYVRLLNANRLPTDIVYLHDEKQQNKNLGAVGEVSFNESLNSFYEQVRHTLPNTEFKTDIIALFQRAYCVGTTFNKAFAALMNLLFPNAGLVFISSNDPKVKKLLVPIFRQEIETVPQTSQLIIERSAELENRYHAQIKPKALNLFLFHKSGRYLIEPKEHDFSLKGIRQYFQKEDLLHMVEETPEVFSPNVVLRPICQDTILPTLCYVAGPAEIAYFAQLKRVYEFFNISMPIIYPRTSVTIIEQRHQEILEKYQLDIIELFEHLEKVQKKVIELVSEVKVDDLFRDTAKDIDAVLNELKFGLNYIDPTLLGALQTTHTKIDALLQVLREKTIEAQKRKHEIALRQIQKVTNTLFPNGNFQERELNVLNFLNKHGMEFLNLLKNEIQIDKFRHQVILI